MEGAAHIAVPGLFGQSRLMLGIAAALQNMIGKRYVQFFCQRCRNFMRLIESALLQASRVQRQGNEAVRSRQIIDLLPQ